MSARLLVPVNADPSSRWGVRQAMRRHAAGEAVEVVLLHVAEPVDRWEVLRFLTPAEIGRFQAARAEAFCAEAAVPLAAAGIPWRAEFRRGAVVPTIIAVAEELACAAILTPPPPAGWRRLAARPTLRALRARSWRVPVMGVDAAGVPVA